MSDAWIRLIHNRRKEGKKFRVRQWQKLKFLSRRILLFRISFNLHFEVVESGSSWKSAGNEMNGKTEANEKRGQRKFTAAKGSRVKLASSPNVRT